MRCMEDFKAAARAAAADESYEAVILNVSEEQKNADRQALNELWNASPDRQGYKQLLSVYSFNSTQRTLTLKEGYLDTPTTRKLFLELNQLYHDITDLTESRSILRGTWRELPEEHKPHSYPVLNRVFFSKGTVLGNAQDGYYRVDEGDFLFMKPGCQHSPDFCTAENKLLKRLTMLAHTP